VGAQLPVFAPPPALLPPMPNDAKADAVLKRGRSEDDDWRVLLKVAMDVHNEYQKALWMPSDCDFRRPDVRANAGGKHVQSADKLLYHQEEISGMYPIEEWHFHLYGDVCILLLDTKGSLLASKDGPPMAINQLKLISEVQWRAIDKVLAMDHLKVLILVSDEPFVFEEDEELRLLPQSWIGTPTMMSCVD